MRARAFRQRWVVRVACSHPARYFACERGQTFVEMAVILPVVIAMILIMFNLASFLNYCAQFDRAARHAVIAHGVSPSGSSSSTSAQDQIATALADSFLDVARVETSVAVQSLSSEGADTRFSLRTHLTRYTCTLCVRVWPSLVSFAGVKIFSPAYLTHSCELVVDRYRPGIVL